MEFIIHKLALVNESRRHYHQSLRSFIVVPCTIKVTAVNPNHLTFALSSATRYLALIGCNLILTFLTILRDGLFIEYFSLPIGSTIFVNTQKLVSILKIYRTIPRESTFTNLSRNIDSLRSFHGHYSKHYIFIVLDVSILTHVYHVVDERTHIL